MTHPITVAGTEIEFPCADGETVLDAAERAGWSIPYSCRKGVCVTCAGDVRDGTVSVRGKGTVTGPASGVLLCQARPDGPVCVAPKRINQSGPPARKTIDAVVYRVRRPAPRVTVLDLRYPIGLRAPFRAGQYLRVLLPDGDSRSYSLANPPQHNDAAQLHVRTEPGGRFSDTLVSTLDKGDRVRVEVPFGEFCLDPDSADPVLLLATGTGFAPVRSIVLDQIARRSARPVHLFWGGRTEADLYAAAELAHLAETRPWFRFTPVLSGVDGAHVQHAALRAHPDLTGHQVYACGNPAMTEDAFAVLGEAGVTEDNFHSDAFLPSGDLQPVT
jgi:NAD(P)H-flavin reductase/ferredoxin